MQGAGILAGAVPEVFWDGLQVFLEEGYGIRISGRDLQKMAERVSQVMKLQGQIRILPGGGEDWKLPAGQGEETRQEGEGLNA